MNTRRSVLAYITFAALDTGIFALGAGLTGCTGTSVDPTKVVDAIKTGCGIAILLTNVAEILKLDPSMQAQQIVDLVCSSYKTALAAKPQGKAEAGSKINFVVTVNGKEVPVEAVVQ